MSTVVFILGAGASRECGGPLMGDFLDIAHDLLLRRDVPPQDEPAFNQVLTALSALQSVHSKANLDTYNIESVFTTFEFAETIKRLPGIDAKEIRDTINALITVIAKTLELRIRFPLSGERIVAAREYAEFAHLAREIIDRSQSHTVSILTFNYDLAVDVALIREDLQLDYALDKPQPNFHKYAIPLLKLHGSLNWAVEDTPPNAVKPLDLHAYLEPSTRPFTPAVGSNETNVPILPHLMDFFASQYHVKVRPQPFIVPPSWNKADYHRQLTNVWSAAAEHLSEALYIFVIGYSLPPTDSFFRQLYALGSAGNSRLRKFIVYDIDQSGQVDARFKDLMGTGVRSRYEYEQIPFKQTRPHILRSLFN